MEEKEEKGDEIEKGEGDGVPGLEAEDLQARRKMREGRRGQ